MATNVHLDIGSSSVKAMVGRRKGSKFIVDAVSIVGYDTGIDIFKNLSSAIKDVLWELDIRRAVLNVSIPSSYFLFRYASFPNIPKRKLEAVVVSEASRYIPSRIRDAIIEAVPFDEGNLVKRPVLLVAIDRDVLISFERAIYTAGYRARLITFEAALTANLVSLVYPLEEKPICVVDIGKSSTNIMILDEDKINFIRTVMIGGVDIDNLIRDRLDVAIDVAETIKKGESAVADVVTLANRVLNHLADEIYISVDYYESQFGEMPEKLILTGGTANLRGLLEFLADRLDFDIQLLNFPESRLLSSDPEVHNFIISHLQELIPVLGMMTI